MSDELMPAAEAIEVLRTVTCRPAGGVEWSQREQAERAVLAEVERLRAELDRLRMTAQGAARRLNEGDVPGARFVLTDESVTS